MQIQGKYRCINCFNELNTENEICSCGYDIAQYKTAMHRLSPGTVLDNRYYIGRVIGEGGFGITYVGYDANLEMRVAIKEFFLSGVNTRNTTYSDEIESSAEEKEVLFETYREKFINEARVLAKFNNEEGIVTVHNFFKANNTAYIIMEFLDGQNLKEYLKSKGKLSTDEVIEIFLPIMRTLDKVHTTKLIHRDISPDNIIFTKNDKVKLLDFGAARDVSDDNKSLSVVLKHGYAPPEQYQTHGKQGPWTDVYALSATIYKCLTGKAPIEAMDRTLGEELEPVFVITSDCSQEVSDVIMKGLEVKISDRYQSMGEMAEELMNAQKSKNDVPQKETENDIDATVLLFDKNTEVIIESNVPDSIGENVLEAPAGKEKKSKTDRSEVSNQAAKTIKRKPFVIVVAIIVCAILGLSFMAFGNGKNKQENSNLQAVVEDETKESQYIYLKSAQVGDIVGFGNYNGYTQWRVLSKDDTNLMLITENIVEKKPFNTANVRCEWSNCTLRTWLNEEYYNIAFSDEEKELIKESEVDGGKDKVFLLSSSDVRTFYNENIDRIAYTAENENICWWLRSPVYDYDNYYYGSAINQNGIYSGDYRVHYRDTGVRPVINITISNL